MTITTPTWDTFMGPLLHVLSDGATRARRELYHAVAEVTHLTPEQMAETIGAGSLRYENRIGWALTYLNRAGALERPMRAQYRITEAGRRLLAEHPDGISERVLNVFAGSEEGSTAWFTAGKEPLPVPIDESVDSDLDPEEQIIQGVDRIHAEVAADLLTRLHDQEPEFFERAVLRLLVAMGYGGADAAVTHTQLSNDEGIDGIIDQDALGLSRIYVQAKRYALDASVGRPEVQAFVGALQGQQASQGVFLTTGRFTTGARDYAGFVSTRVVLIDGARLAALMIRYGVGVQVKRVVKIVEVDEDFFE